MNTYKVWFALNPLAMVHPSLDPSLLEQTHEFVGLIQGNDQEAAWIKAQQPERCEFPRSMAVGDVLEARDSFHLVNGKGWETFRK